MKVKKARLRLKQDVVRFNAGGKINFFLWLGLKHRDLHFL